MDPNETLAKLRDVAAHVNGPVFRPAEELEDAAYDMAEFFQALDRWLSKGGFLPGDWNVAHPAPRP